MYLYEVGTDNSLAALKAAAEDKEFEVKLQVKWRLPASNRVRKQKVPFGSK